MRVQKSTNHFCLHTNFHMSQFISVFRRATCLVFLFVTIVMAAITSSQIASAQNDSLREQVRALPLDGAAFEGKLVAADGKWGLAFEAVGGSRKVAAEDLLRWGRPAELRRGPVLVLCDGGVLRADAIEYDGTVAKIESALFGDVSLAGELVAGIVLELPVDMVEADLLLDWAAGKNKLPPRAQRRKAGKKGGRIRLLNGDVLTGRGLRVDAENVSIETEVGPVATDLGRVEAIRFDRSLNNAQALTSGGDEMKAWIGLGDGSLLLVRRFVLDSKKLVVSLLGNERGDTPGWITRPDWVTGPEELVFLQPMGAKAIYLSDLRAAEYRHVPYLQLSWPYGIDRNAIGGHLRSGGRLFVKGLGVHSSARLTYLLDKPFSRFEASTAIDNSAAGRGSARFRVYVDGQKKYSGPVVRGKDLPVPVSVDIRGAKRLDLIVDFADRAGQEDRADWLEARLLR